MQHWKLALGAALGTLTFAAVAGAADPPASPDMELQYGVCVSCHGAHGEGRPELNGPRIGDLDAASIEAALRAYRADQRTGPNTLPMRAAVAGLSDAQIADLSTYVAGLDPEQRSPGPGVEGGEEAYASCAGCHGEDAKGSPTIGAPALLNQSPSYLESSLRDYREGARGAPGSSPNAMTMAAMSQALSDAQIEQIIRHIGSLRPERTPPKAPTGSATEQEGLAAFNDIYAVVTSPRCMNCHPDGDTPYQGDDGQLHTQGVDRFSPNSGLHCSTCHAATPSGDGLAPLPPADPIWSLAPKAMVFENRSPAELCSQLLDVETNGGRGPVELTEHVAGDHLLQTSWHSGRTPPPLTHQELVARFETWANAGAPCPE
ncbi:MAG: c-type cytochrome [Myxococcota bacterium]|nr:c-type cytochrome [Myxococcota bacterium]